MSAGEICCLDRRSVGVVDGMRPDRENFLNMRMEQQSASNCLKEKCDAINMDKSRDCMPRDSKTMKSNQLLCGRGVPCKDEGRKKGSFLANYNYIL